VSVSPLISADTLATADQLWLFAELFRHEWSSGAQLSREYRTNVEFALSAAEQRYGLLSRPVHGQKVRFQAGGTRMGGVVEDDSPAREVSALRSIAQRYSIAKSLWPLFSDYVSTLVSFPMGTDAFPHSGENRENRFEVGTRVLIVNNAQSGPYYNKDRNLHVSEVVSVVFGFGKWIIIIADPLPVDFASGSRIYPLMEARLIFKVDGSVSTDRFIALDVTVDEEEGPTQLSGSTPVGDSPTGYIGNTPTVIQEHDGLPIFDPDYDYGENISWGFVRRGQRSSEGISGINTVYGSRGMFTCSFNLRSTTRTQAFEWIRFFDSRGGRLHPFWFISPMTEYYEHSNTAGANDQISVRTGGNDLDWDFRPYIYIKETDGTIHIRGVSIAVQTAEDLYLLTLDSALPGPLAASEIDSVGIAYKARFDSDEMVEQWTTTEVMETSLSIIELENEKTVTIGDITEYATSDLQVDATQGDCSGASFLLIPCFGCGSQMTVCDESLTGGTTIELVTAAHATSTTYSAGDHVIAGSDTFKALNSGTSAGSAPTWPTNCGDTVFDNDIEWELSDKCYTVSAVPVGCNYGAINVFDDTLTSCLDCVAEYPCPAQEECDGECGLIVKGQFVEYTAECFCNNTTGPGSIECNCVKSTEGCESYEGQTIDCTNGIYSVTATGGTGTCCGMGSDCTLLRMTRLDNAPCIG